MITNWQKDEFIRLASAARTLLATDDKEKRDTKESDAFAELANLVSAVENLIDDVLPPVEEVIQVPAKNGVIIARKLPDDEFPAISLVYHTDTNGEPGVVLEHDTHIDAIRLHVWDEDSVDNDPIESFCLDTKNS